MNNSAQKLRRFRTLIESAIGMFVPAGTTFTATGPDWRCEFDDPQLRTRFDSCIYGCSDPEYWIAKGDIEELFESSPADRLAAGELMEVTRLTDAEFDELEAAWNCSPKHQLRYGVRSDGLITPARSHEIRSIRNYCKQVSQLWYAKLIVDSSESKIPEPKPTQTEKEERPMTSIIKIEKNVTLLDGTRPSQYGAAARSNLIERQEDTIKTLEALEFKTQETLDEIAALRANLTEVIAAFDAEYAARKAKEAAKD